jgi:hypothetical protein
MIHTGRHSPAAPALRRDGSVACPASCGEDTAQENCLCQCADLDTKIQGGQGPHLLMAFVAHAAHLEEIKASLTTYEQVGPRGFLQIAPCPPNRPPSALSRSPCCVHFAAAVSCRETTWRGTLPTGLSSPPLTGYGI